MNRQSQKSNLQFGANVKRKKNIAKTYGWLSLRLNRTTPVLNKKHELSWMIAIRRKTWIRAIVGLTTKLDLNIK